jgi:AAA+ superfamily predicted ATPase
MSNTSLTITNTTLALHNQAITNIIAKKIILLQEVVKKTILAVQRYKALDIFGANEYNICTAALETIFGNLKQILYPIQKKQNYDHEQIINKLQDINSELSSLFKTFGTEDIEDLINICFGQDFIKKYILKAGLTNKFEVMKQYVHPISYKAIPWKPDHPKNKNKKVLQKNRIVEDFMIVESSETLECFDLARTSKSFQTKVYGIKFAIQNPAQKKTLIISAIVDELMIDCLNYTFIEERIVHIRENKPNELEYNSEAFNVFMSSLSLKELLVYEDEKLYTRFIGYMNQVHLIKQKTISQVTKEFINSELYSQRTTMIQLLIKSNEHEYQYLAYLLYDLLSSDTNGSIDSQEQTLLFDSLPWNIKKHFRDAMKQTINYTNYLTNFDTNNIPLEQQICLLKANDTIKEKAMLKLKEVKAKSEDSGTKARQYLEGLLRIPFGIYRNEPILNVIQECSSTFSALVAKLQESTNPITQFPIKPQYTSAEVFQYNKYLSTEYLEQYNETLINSIIDKLNHTKRSVLIDYVGFINNLIKSRNINYTKIRHSGKRATYMIEGITVFLQTYSTEPELLNIIALQFKNIKNNPVKLLTSCCKEITDNNNQVKEYMKSVTDILDASVHGHEKAKRQIERIIGQWINGEKSGYCFGFEGPPGVGKTSLAKKGIAKCLTDGEGGARPFSFIAIGGSSNGSTLDGHNYTYVGSTWGKIVDILMDKKCMNPIIFIDELDKVSQTEHGKEIIGILTHLIDPTQNDAFQDKYFNGIELDLSKALFIFSYNNVDAIDRILLDRIHRIKFDFLSLENKLTIAKDYLFPEIFTNMGLDGVIKMDDEVIKYIITEYTCEPGVRKLKELFFEIFGEINLINLKTDDNIELPITVTKHDVKYKYLKNRHEIRHKQVNSVSSIGVITGLWANAVGQGGVLPIESKLFPCNSFLDLKLTGMQGDVMKESMKVAKTLAWSLLTKSQMTKLQKDMTETKYQGLHIHVPEGATPKDGPSAGTAITVVMYSLFTKKKIRHDVAITGEMCLQGKVTAIGGLDLKIMGGIRSGVKHFIYPKENDKDFNDFMDKYRDNPMLEGIHFHEVETIQEVFKLVLC